MKTAIYIQNPLVFLKHALCIATYVLCSTTLANADSQTTQTTPDKGVDLELSLPSHWQQTEISPVSGLQQSTFNNNAASEQNNGEAKKASRINVGCNLSNDETVLVASSMTQRVEGNCKLNYHY